MFQSAFYKIASSFFDDGVILGDWPLGSSRRSLPLFVVADDFDVNDNAGGPALLPIVDAIDTVGAAVFAFKAFAFAMSTSSTFLSWSSFSLCGSSSRFLPSTSCLLR